MCYTVCMKKILVSVQQEIQTFDQYFDSVICSPFFKLNIKSNAIEIYLDNPSEPALPVTTDYTYIVP